MLPPRHKYRKGDEQIKMAYFVDRQGQHGASFQLGDFSALGTVSVTPCSGPVETGRPR